MSQTLTSSLVLAGEWFLSSGIQEAAGGVARYYLAGQRKNARVSTEITGYAVSALVYLFDQTGDQRYLDAALRAARFLVDSAWDSSLSVFPFEHSVNGDLPRRLAYFFDSGIIVRGLLALWRANRNDSLLAAAVACGESMIRDFLRNGPVDPILELPSRNPLPHAGTWSRNPGCYQLKSALAWHDLCDVTGEKRFLDAYEKVLAQSLLTQAAFLPGETDRNLVMDRLHAYLYFLEGLLPCYQRTECRAVVRSGLATAAQLLRELAPAFERSDVCAQLVRIRLFADALGAADLDRAAAQEEVERIRAYQIEDSDPPSRGGFWFGRKEGCLLPYVNPVSTAFGFQGLEMWRQWGAGEFRASRHELI